jgi:hypothetical protein
MKGKMLFLSLVSLGLGSALDASVFLHNDSGFRLKAVVIAANGTIMGEKMLDPEQSGYVEDFIGQSDPVGQQQTPEGNSNISVTPYTVFWYCEKGELYSTCVQIGTGALAAPNMGQGPMTCPPPSTQDKNTNGETYGGD